MPTESVTLCGGQIDEEKVKIKLLITHLKSLILFY
jgi:hypothetical protein